MRDDEKPIGVAVLGLGNVGSEVVRIIEESADDLDRPHRRPAGAARRRGAPRGRRPRRARRAADRRRRGPGLPRRRRHRRRGDGPVEPARKAILAALEQGKSVVTANKALMAESTGELAQAAESAHVDLYFEAAVAGAIPVIRPLTQSLAGDTVLRVAGIVNGTTNYILSAMDETGADYDSALADASALGYAEADPTADVEGYDAAAKAAILASIAFHTRVTADDVYREGITKVTAGGLRVGPRTRLHDQAAGHLRADHQRRRAATGLGPRLPGAGAAGASAGHGQRRVQRRRRRGRGRRTADVLRPGRRRRPDRLGGDGRPGDGRAQPRAGRPRPARVEVRQAADRADRLHPHPLLREHERRRPARRAVRGRSRIRQARGQHRRGPPGGHGRRGGQRCGARIVVVTHRATDAALSETVDALADLDVVQSINSVLRLEGTNE